MFRKLIIFAVSLLFFMGRFSEGMDSIVTPEPFEQRPDESIILKTPEPRKVGVAIWNIDTQDAIINKDILIGKLKQEILKYEIFNLCERTEKDNIDKELKMQYDEKVSPESVSGNAFDPNTIEPLGKYYGAQLVITAKIGNFENMFSFSFDVYDVRTATVFFTWNRDFKSMSNLNDIAHQCANDFYKHFEEKIQKMVKDASQLDKVNPIESMRIREKILTDFSKSKYSDDALFDAGMYYFQRAQEYLSRNDFKIARRIFQLVQERYPHGDKEREALFYEAECSYLSIFLLKENPELLKTNKRSEWDEDITVKEGVDFKNKAKDRYNLLIKRGIKDSIYEKAKERLKKLEEKK